MTEIPRRGCIGVHLGHRRLVLVGVVVARGGDRARARAWPGTAARRSGHGRGRRTPRRRGPGTPSPCGTCSAPSAAPPRRLDAAAMLGEAGRGGREGAGPEQGRAQAHAWSPRPRRRPRGPPTSPSSSPPARARPPAPRSHANSRRGGGGLRRGDAHEPLDDEALVRGRGDDRGRRRRRAPRPAGPPRDVHLDVAARRRGVACDAARRRVAEATRLVDRRRAARAARACCAAARPRKCHVERERADRVVVRDELGGVVLARRRTSPTARRGERARRGRRTCTTATTVTSSGSRPVGGDPLAHRREAAP